MVHGYGKVFTSGTAAVSESFAQMGVFQPQITGPLVAYTELIGGACLILGLLTPIASVMLAGVMAVAILKVHLAAGLTGPGGYEYPLSLLAGALTLLFLGPGPISLDKKFFCRGNCPTS